MLCTYLQLRMKKNLQASSTNINECTRVQRRVYSYLYYHLHCQCFTFPRVLRLILGVPPSVAYVNTRLGTLGVSDLLTVCGLSSSSLDTLSSLLDSSACVSTASWKVSFDVSAFVHAWSPIVSSDSRVLPTGGTGGSPPPVGHAPPPKFSKKACPP